MDSCLDLSLDFTLSSKIINDCVAQVSGSFSESEMMKLGDYVNRLQHEMSKVDAFKRELPLIVLLVNDVIGKLKDKLALFKRSNSVPVLEEFIPLKKSCTNEKDEKIENDKENDAINNGEKRNWMSHVQLWTSDNLQHHPSNTVSIINEKSTKEENKVKMVDTLFQNIEHRNFRTAFTPFKGYPYVPVLKNDRDELPAVTKLSLCTPEMKNSREEINSIGFSPKSSSSRSDGQSSQSSFKPVQPQTSRKQRRCWSPELHRRFVSALQELGGVQAATPKQIREHMQVDGLTNDEVKSHLQKYRLHNRKAIEKSSRANNSLSPEGPFQLASSMHGVDSMEDDQD